MASFFEKLKKGMGVEEITEETPEEKPARKMRKKRAKKSQKENNYSKLEIKTAAIEEPEVKEETRKITPKVELSSVETKIETKAKKPPLREGPEGQLTIDIYQTSDDLVIQSAVAGVKPENLDIAIEGDVITIRGIREKPEEKEEISYFYQECFWGPFSREAILPTEVDPSRAEAELKEGILTVRIPKIEKRKRRKITVKG